MNPAEMLTELHTRGVELVADGGKLRYRAPVGSLTPELRQALVAQKPELLKLLAAPEADYLTQTPCEVCSSRERWTWLDGRALCRVCLVLDLAPLTLVRQGWPDHPKRRRRRG